MRSLEPSTSHLLSIVEIQSLISKLLTVKSPEVSRVLSFLFWSSKKVWCSFVTCIAKGRCSCIYFDKVVLSGRIKRVALHGCTFFFLLNGFAVLQQIPNKNEIL